MAILPLKDGFVVSKDAPTRTTVTPEQVAIGTPDWINVNVGKRVYIIPTDQSSKVNEAMNQIDPTSSGIDLDGDQERVLLEELAYLDVPFVFRIG